MAAHSLAPITKKAYVILYHTPISLVIVNSISAHFLIFHLLNSHFHHFSHNASLLLP